MADVTIHCSAKKNVDQVMEAAAVAKQKKHGAAAQTRGAQMAALVFDAFGGVHPQTQAFFKQMKQSGVSRNSDKTVRGIMWRMRQEISVAIHRYNAQCFSSGVAASVRRGALFE
jgi:hypothetical protein